MNLNNMIDMRKVRATPVLRELQILSFWIPLMVILSKFHLAHMICQSFLQRLVLIMMWVRVPH
jgi:hypothetical protein